MTAVSTFPRDAFVAAMGAAVSGVTVVTTASPGGPIGRTISAMASVSADPPLLLMCVRRGSPLRDAIAEHGSFAVNVLGAHQAAIADAFAGRPGSGAPFAFDPSDWATGLTGAPLLTGAAATFQCRVVSCAEAGTHTVILGGVLVSAPGVAAPLAYSGRRYARPAPLRTENLSTPSEGAWCRSSTR
jgi:flavin reductase